MVPKITFWAMGILITPPDKARRVLPGTRIEGLEHVPRRIATRITLAVSYILW
jgi:hypothetical protein